jgi:hypothetical protein
VRVKADDVASAHLTEEGHVAHRLLELSAKTHAIKLAKRTRHQHIHPAA